MPETQYMKSGVNFLPLPIKVGTQLVLDCVAVQTWALVHSGCSICINSLSMLNSTKGLTSTREAPGLSPTLYRGHVVLRRCYPSTREGEAGRSKVQSHSQLHREFEVNLGKRFCL